MKDLFGNEIKPRLLLSFSGGATSGRMTYYMWNEWPDRHKWDIKVVFANTGLEHPKTLDFVAEFEQKFNIPIVWVEGKYKDRTGRPYSKKGWSVRHQVVNRETAAIATEISPDVWSWTPFEEMISLLGIPSTAVPFCSDQMKRKVIESYLKSIGWRDFHKAIGIRADEIDRVKPDYKEQKIMYPLVQMDLDKLQILEWWEKQTFRLEVPAGLGNCQNCWKKNGNLLCSNAINYPETYNWWKYITKKYGHLKPRKNKLNPPFNFYRGNMSPWDIEKLSMAEGEERKKILELISTGNCSESCEAF